MWQALASFFSPAVNSVNGLAQTFFGNKAEREIAAASEDSQTEQEFSSEFQGRFIKGTWFDSLMDGINRLPRPVIVFSVFYLFLDAYRNPANFIVVMDAMALIPQALWTLLYKLLVFIFLPG